MLSFTFRILLLLLLLLGEVAPKWRPDGHVNGHQNGDVSFQRFFSFLFFFWVFQSSVGFPFPSTGEGFYWVVLGFTRFCWVLPGNTGFF